MMAEIKEEICIGCTRCFKVCPTDAIMGAAQQIMRCSERRVPPAANVRKSVRPNRSNSRPIPATLQSWYWHKPVQVATA